MQLSSSLEVFLSFLSCVTSFLAFVCETVIVGYQCLPHPLHALNFLRYTDGERLTKLEVLSRNKDEPMKEPSLLKQERLKRGWPRAKVEALTEQRISASSLERWEEGKTWPRADNLNELCKLYNKTPKQLGLDRSSDIMVVRNNNAPSSQEEKPTMSDLIRRSALSDLGSYLTGLVSTWPRRNHHYEELQEGINKAAVDHSTLVGQDAISALSRRQALMSLGLVPIRLIGGIPITDAKKVDTDHLLTHCAAGIAACWYLRRGKDLEFVNDLTSSYISILQPLTYAHSEAYRKASATLLSQSFGLKSKLVNALQDDDQAMAYEEEAIRYSEMAESITEQTIANREMAVLYWKRKKYTQALPYAETAYGLARSNKATPKIIISFTASGLANCQASSGLLKDAQISLKEAHDFFDPTTLIPSMPYGEAILTGIDAWIYQHMGNFKEAIDSWKQYKVLSTTVLGVIEGNIEHAKTEISRGDKPRDMNLCIKLLTEAITGANELNSKRYIGEARECYNLLRIAWPREDAIKKLGEDHFGAKK